MTGHGEILADNQDKSKKDESKKTPLDLYIGIFFDGTNNNKYQTMLGKMFRRKEIFKKAIQRQCPDQKYLQCTNGEPIIVSSVEQLLKKYSRAEVEEIFRGAFTRSELEFLYYGYGNINDATDKSYSTIVETKNAIELREINPNRLSALPDDSIERATLYHKAKDFAIRKDSNTETIESFKGAAAQDTTYTNVAILESLYKCDNVKDDNTGEIKERHVSIYVEGSGADMQFKASTAKGYIGTIGVAGLGLGTGPTGVVSKIRKASSMVNRLLDQYKCMDDVNVKFHFDLFGFSRGATCARVMAYLINSNPETNKAYSKNGKSIQKKDDDLLLLTSQSKEFLPIDNITIEKEIRFMGLFDTVSSIGVIDEDVIISILRQYINDTIEAEEGPNKKDIPTLWYTIKPKILPACKNVANYIGKRGGETLGKSVAQSIPITGPILGELGGIIGEWVGGILGDYFGEKAGNYITDKVGSKVDPIIDEIKKYVQEGKYQYRDKGTEDLSAITEGKSPYHRDNVKDYGLWATSLAKKVVHICAMDEVRKNFALVDIQSSLEKGTGTEVFIPGCHTDIGGGASIGMEEEKIINKNLNRFLTTSYVHSKSWLEDDKTNDLVKPITVENLKEMGWLNGTSKEIGFFEKKRFNGRSKIDEDETYFSDNRKLLFPSNIIMYRHVTPGYSNVALNYMKEQAVDNPFDEIPLAYNVPNDLNGLFNKLHEIASHPGRFFVYPEKIRQYSELRRKYIHFSFNEQLQDKADNIFVNGPEYTEIHNTIHGDIKVNSRIIYPGTLDDGANTVEPKHMFDYDESEPVQQEPPQPQSGLHPLLSGDSTLFQEYDTSNDRIFIKPLNELDHD